MSPRADGVGGSEPSEVLLSAECRPLRRALRPLVWVILEEVALDTVVEGGQLVARTSARQVAERLGIDPGTAAAALRELRRRGLLASFRETGRAGRFGLSIYQLCPVAGLTVMSPCTAQPGVASPVMAQPRVAEPPLVPPCSVLPCAEEPVATSPDGDQPGHRPAGTAGPDMDLSPPGAPDGGGARRPAGSARRPTRRPVPGGQPAPRLLSAGQETFDFGSVWP